LLRETGLPNLDSRGFVEATTLAGTVDVVVTEGFAGNIALKNRGRHGQSDSAISAEKRLAAILCRR
jgi:fatty acid/phospholipid biosynthesis enzyme